MNYDTTSRTHWSFWAVGAISLIWNVMGAINFFVQRNPDVLAQYTEVARAIVENRPAWATVAFAIAVFGGALGCLLLLLRKSAAFHVFIVSLVAMTVQMLPVIGMVGSPIGLGPFEISTYVLMPLLVAVFLIWYSKYAAARNWIS